MGDVLIRYPDGSSFTMKTTDANFSTEAANVTAAWNSYNKAQKTSKALQTASSLMQVSAPELAAMPEEVDSSAVYSESISSFLQNFPQLLAMSTTANEASLTSQLNAMEKAIPGLGATIKGLVAQVQTDQKSLASGTLPQETQDFLSQKAAEMGVTRGTSGGFNSFSLLKDFGTSTMDYQNNLSSRISSTLNTLNQFVPTSNFVSPTTFMMSPTAITQQKQTYNNNITSLNQSYLNAVNNANNYNKSILGQTLLAQAAL